MKYLRFLAPILVLLLAAGACAAGQTVTARGQDGRPKVVATFSVAGDLARNVGGDRIALVTLVGPNGDVHTFEPSPADSAALRARAKRHACGGAPVPALLNPSRTPRAQEAGAAIRTHSESRVPRRA